MHPNALDVVIALATVGTTCFTALLALATFGLVLVTAGQIHSLRVQLRQASEQQMTEISNKNNWVLFEHRKDLPNLLPSWADLDDNGWAWRVLCLNHLNLLKAAHQDYQKGVMSKKDHEAWVLRARY